jgi:hypothetical protein
LALSLTTSIRPWDDGGVVFDVESYAGAGAVAARVHGGDGQLVPAVRQQPGVELEAELDGSPFAQLERGRAVGAVEDQREFG